MVDAAYAAGKSSHMCSRIEGLAIVIENCTRILVNGGFRLFEGCVRRSAFVPDVFHNWGGHGDNYEELLKNLG